MITCEAVGPLEVAALLDVGVLVDDAGLQRGEVGRGPRQQVVGDVLLEPVLARRRRRAGRCTAVPHVAIARASEVSIELELAAVRRERDQLHVVAGRLPGARADQAVGARQLERQEVADLQVDRGRAPVLPTGLTIAWS